MSRGDYSVCQTPPDMSKETITERKRSLLDIGRRLFITNGYAATSIDEICAIAGVTKGGFFHYFSTKESFARELLTDTWQAFEHAHGEIESQEPSDALHDHIDFMIEFISGQGRLIPRLAQELGASNREVRHQIRGYFQTWTGHLSSMLERAGCGEESSATMEFIIAAIEGAPMVAGQLGAQVITNTAAHLKRYVDGVLSVQ